MHKNELQILEKQLKTINKEIEGKRDASDIEKLKSQAIAIEESIKEIEDSKSIKMSFSVFGVLIGFVTTLTPIGALAGLGIGKILDDGAAKVGINSKMSLKEIIASTPRNFINLVNYSNEE